MPRPYEKKRKYRTKEAQCVSETSVLEFREFQLLCNPIMLDQVTSLFFFLVFRVLLHKNRYHNFKKLIGTCYLECSFANSLGQNLMRFFCQNSSKKISSYNNLLIYNRINDHVLIMVNIGYNLGFIDDLSHDNKTKN